MYFISTTTHFMNKHTGRFFALTNEGKEKEVPQRQLYNMTIYKDIMVIIHRGIVTGESWCVSDYTTGVLLAQADTRKEALAQLLSLQAQHDENEFRQKRLYYFNKYGMRTHAIADLPF